MLSASLYSLLYRPREGEARTSGSSPSFRSVPPMRRGLPLQTDQCIVAPRVAAGRLVAQRRAFRAAFCARIAARTEALPEVRLDNILVLNIIKY